MFVSYLRQFPFLRLLLFLSLFVLLFDPLKIISSLFYVIFNFAGKFGQNGLYFGTLFLGIMEPG
jgi:hypothetical protein